MLSEPHLRWPGPPPGRGLYRPPCASPFASAPVSPRPHRACPIRPWLLWPTCRALPLPLAPAVP
eukprot:1418176-Heterocapsa_arctica.AAC.1